MILCVSVVCLTVTGATVACHRHQHHPQLLETVDSSLQNIADRRQG